MPDLRSHRHRSHRGRRSLVSDHTVDRCQEDSIRSIEPRRSLSDHAQPDRLLERDPRVELGQAPLDRSGKSVDRPPLAAGKANDPPTDRRHDRRSGRDRHRGEAVDIGLV